MNRFDVPEGGAIPDMVIAIVAALAAGASFAAAGILQQRAAATRPQNESLSFGCWPT